jgi:hypothetical protein
VLATGNELGERIAFPLPLILLSMWFVALPILPTSPIIIYDSAPLTCHISASAIVLGVAAVGYYYVVVA